MAQQLHIFFFPLMAAGHIIPMVDMARLFVDRGVKATFLAPAAANNEPPPMLDRCIKRARDSGHHIDLLLLQFPSAANPATFLTSAATSMELFVALEQLRDPLEQALQEQPPSCIISDMYLPWTGDVARRLGVPRFVFHGMGFFPLCALDSLDRHNTKLGDGEVVSVPGLPHRVAMKRSQLHQRRKKFTAFMERMKESELRSHGLVVNSFYEMEPEYADHYRNVMGRKAWHVGPVSHCNRDGGAAEMTERSASIMTWLDSKLSNSVVYVCFGSLCRLAQLQMQELGRGLEASNHPFIWVINDDDDEEHLRIGGQETIREEGKGLIVRGWAPQRVILNHRAAGAFLTHCGWNSVMEAVSAGVPMVTWPAFAEQFYNERLVVDVLRVGVSVGAEVWGMEEEKKPVVGGDAIAKAVARLMDHGGGDDGGVRRRAAELERKARDAVDVGGSSYLDINRLICELSSLESKGKERCN